MPPGDSVGHSPCDGCICMICEFLDDCPVYGHIELVRTVRNGGKPIEFKSNRCNEVCTRYAKGKRPLREPPAVIEQLGMGVEMRHEDGVEKKARAELCAEFRLHSPIRLDPEILESFLRGERTEA